MTRDNTVQRITGAVRNALEEVLDHGDTFTPDFVADVFRDWNTGQRLEFLDLLGKQARRHEIDLRDLRDALDGVSTDGRAFVDAITPERV